MDRRDFLKGAAAASVAGTAVAGSGCATPGVVPTPQASSVADLAGFLARLDRGLEVIDGGEVLPRLVPPDARVDPAKAREVTPLFQRTMRVLYATGAIGELAPADQLHPGVQDRMWRLLPEVEEVMDAHERLLAGLRPSDHARLQAHLRADPSLPLRIAEVLDDAAVENGLGPSRRGRLRLAATDVGTRLRTQPPALLVGEYLDKARRIEERSDPLGATQRALAARVGEAAFWDSAAWVDRETLAWRERLAAAGSGDGEVGTSYSADHEASRRFAMRGAKLLGWGVIVGGVSAGLLAAGAVPAVFGVTVGVVLLAIGLVTLVLAALVGIGEEIAEGSRRGKRTPAPQAPAAVTPSVEAAAPEVPALAPEPPVSAPEAPTDPPAMTPAFAPAPPSLDPAPAR